VDDKELSMVRKKGETAAIFSLQSSGLLMWPEQVDDKDALYVHKVCVRRDHVGTGLPDAIFAFCKAKGKSFLRLDCADRKTNQCLPEPEV